MANYQFTIANGYFDGTTRIVDLYVCDTDAGKPTSGFNVGDLIVCLDTGVIWLATGASTIVAFILATGGQDATQSGAWLFTGNVTFSTGAVQLSRVIEASSALEGRVVVKGVGGSAPAVGLGSLDLTGQNAAIGSTALATAPGAGIYRVSVYHMVTTAGSAGTLATTIGWTDNVGATTQKPAADLSLSGTGRASGSCIIRVNGATDITYQTTMAGATGSPVYALYARVERI